MSRIKTNIIISIMAIVMLVLLFFIGIFSNDLLKMFICFVGWIISASVVVMYLFNDWEE